VQDAGGVEGPGVQGQGACLLLSDEPRRAWSPEHSVHQACGVGHSLEGRGGGGEH